MLVPCASPVSPSDHRPAASALVVAFVALFEMIAAGSAVPENTSGVDVEIAPSADGAVMTGADGGAAADVVDDDEGDVLAEDAVGVGF